MFDESDPAAALTDLGQRIRKDAKGTILLVLDKETKMYEVEFVDERGNSIDALSVHGESLRRI